ncbi:MAG: DNA-directed RNA polymerase subunit omega [Aquificaceae bacterium]|nr:DNA-directed RNA polymerase subunit omega [Aquificaceae bacterium]MDW8237294.1 DNA-directed RNA polymerase subunit omega [Aquificaceae bacterium]
MSALPPIERALKNVSSRYELVHAAAKRAAQLLERDEDIFVRGRQKNELVKKTCQAIVDIAENKVACLKIKPENNGE